MLETDPMSQALADLYQRALSERVRALAEQIAEISAEPVSGRRGLSVAHEILRPFPDWMRDETEAVLAVASTPEHRASLLQRSLETLTEVSGWVDQLFARGSSLKIPLSLFDAVARHAQEADLKDREFVLMIGGPDNFELTPTDLFSLLFSEKAFPPPDKRPTRALTMLTVPTLEGCETLWWPIVLGHELAHLLVDRHSSEIQLYDTDLAGRIDTPADAGADEVEIKAKLWLIELLCDAFTVHRYGPAGAAALAEFFTVVGWGDPGRRTVPSHPPSRLRIELMLGWLAEPTDGAIREAVERVLQPWRDLLARPDPSPPTHQLTLSLSAQFRIAADDIMATVRAWGIPGYDINVRTAAINHAVSQLSNGIPPDGFIPGRPAVDLTDVDVINAGWLERARESEWRVERLVAKSLDALVFRTVWNAGDSPTIAVMPDAKLQPGVLSLPAIELVLARQVDRLVVSPLVAGSLQVGNIDIRLGPQLIVFRRTETSALSHLRSEEDPRRLQRRLEVGWEESFFLHPGELVLASTIEFFDFPGDLAAQVITRSSYGRAGLITATAVQVHPHYRGCLTLELLNVGQMPLELRPGERIAQLVLMTVTPRAPAPDPDLDPPTGPKFSYSRLNEQEQAVVRRLSERSDEVSLD